MGDWQETLFCWRGSVEISAEPRAVVWSGAWVGSAGELPSESAFAASENKFELRASLGDGDAVATPYEALCGRSVAWSGSYLLDNGDGAERFRDHKHAAFFGGEAARGAGDEASHAGPALAVVARGETEFGSFVSRGVLQQAGTAGVCTLILCRRYVRDRDARLKLSLADLLGDCIGDPAPWRSLPFRLPKKPKARAKAGASGAGGNARAAKRQKKEKEGDTAKSPRQVPRAGASDSDGGVSHT
eukprot:g5875.t1